MTPLQCFILVIVHFVFVWLQPRQIQNRKSSQFKYLLLHTLITIIPLTTAITLMFDLELKGILIVFFVNFLSHFVVDYVSSNVVVSISSSEESLFLGLSKEWRVIAVTALDQLIHFGFIFLSINMIKDL